MKIVHLITSLNIGGTETMLYRLLERLDRSRYSSTVLYLKERGPVADRIESLGIPVRSVGGNPRNPISSFLRVRTLLHESKPDLLVTHLYRANILGRVAGKAAGVKRIISTQKSTDDWRRAFHTLLDRWTSRWVERIVVNSSLVKEVLVRREKVAADKIIIVPNGVDTDYFRPNPEHKDPTELVVGTVARLHYAKGIDLFLESAKLLLQSLPSLKFVVAGDGPKRVRLVRLAKELGISDSVAFPGFIEDIPPLLNSFDVFVLPSRWEGMPSALLEAMACGIPCVATGVSGVNEIIPGKEFGLVIPPETPSALADAVKQLLDDPRLRSSMSTAVRQRIVEHFSITRTVSLLEALFSGQ